MKKIISMVLTGVLAISCVIYQTTIVSASENDSYVITTPYEYPLKPGSEEWNALPSVVERREACDIPEEILRKMTTRALVETVISYPFFVDVYCFNSFEEGLDWVSNYFAGINELKGRQDVRECLQEYLDDYADDFRELTSNCSPDQKQRLRYAAKAERLLLYFDTRSEPLTMKGTKSPRYYSTSVMTPNRSSVSVYAGLTYGNFGTTYEMALEDAQELLQSYPSAHEVFSNSISPSYNCHSYAWYSQLSSNTYWMDDPTPYISDGSYVGTYPMVGCRITYYKSSSSIPYIHSGIIDSVGATPDTTYETSKWGCYGVYSHRVDDCPYYSGSALGYWKLNVN